MVPADTSRAHGHDTDETDWAPTESVAFVRATVHAAPQLCAAGAEVVWTRHRAEPDLTPSIRRWFEETGYEEVDFATSEDLSDSWAVGVHRLIRDPEPLRADQHWFSFLR